MAENLVVVESPAKAKTIKKYLGKDFEVLASYGHVRDLVPKEGAVDPEHGYAMRYQVLEKNERHIESISRGLAKSKALYLATDPDREGEAIAWHLKEILKSRGDLDGKAVHRVVFYEITRNAVREAVAQPRNLSLDLVNAQQARRALDYLVGFNLSPLLWKKVRRGLSAGRVQSPALRMICEREEEIAAFVAQEYWTLEGEGTHQSPLLPAEADRVRRQESRAVLFYQRDAGARGRALDPGRGTPGRGAGGQPRRAIWVSCASSPWTASSGGVRRRRPSPPRRCNRRPPASWVSTRGERCGSRSSSMRVRISVRATSASSPTCVRTPFRSRPRRSGRFARSRGACTASPRWPRSRASTRRNRRMRRRRTRPSARHRPPSRRAMSRARSSSDLYRLYALIWKRAVASQMAPAVFDTVAVDMLAGPDGPERHVLRANGSTLVKPGFIAVYQESADDVKSDEGDHVLPPLAGGRSGRSREAAGGSTLHGAAAALLRSLAGEGAGGARHRPSFDLRRPSSPRCRTANTWRWTNRRFLPTDIGKIVNRFLTDHFHRYVEYGFTAAMEDELDAISRGEEEWTQPLDKFWKPFIRQVELIEKNVSREEVAQAREIGKDPATGKPVTVRMGQYGPFVQIGTKDDVEKPRFAGLRPGQKMDAITLADAMELFKLPRALGQTAAGEMSSPTSAASART